MRSISSQLIMAVMAMLMLTVPVMAAGPPDVVPVVQLDTYLNVQNHTVEFNLVADLATVAFEHNYSGFETGADLIRLDGMEVRPLWPPSRRATTGNAKARHRLSSDNFSDRSTSV